MEKAKEGRIKDVKSSKLIKSRDVKKMADKKRKIRKRTERNKT
jgi:hypothetical protein